MPREKRSTYCSGSVVEKREPLLLESRDTTIEREQMANQPFVTVLRIHVVGQEAIGARMNLLRLANVEGADRRDRLSWDNLVVFSG